MNLKEHYWYFEEILKPAFCDKIIKHALQTQKAKLAVTNEFENKEITKKDLKVLKKIRNSDVIWLNDPWIYDKIIPLIYEANKYAEWNFEFDWFEQMQFTIYGKNQHYDWHWDSINSPYESPDVNFNGKIRKVSVTVALSDSSEYTGGKLQFDLRNTNKGSNIIECKQIYKKGSVVVFPSHIWHRVSPVTKGTRYSLVIWGLGRPFK